MIDSRPLASLGPGLLARKGSARPAMRPQLVLSPPAMATPAVDADDLGWNDMGHGHDDPAPPTRPAQVSDAPVSNAPVSNLLATTAPMHGVAAKKSAFTLRLDADRHLKLRLACTVQNRSAQRLLTDLIDRYLAEAPDIEALAAQARRA